MSGHLNNPLRQQCRSLYQLAPIQFEKSLEGAQSLLSEEIVRRIDRIIITGCGDSYFAALEASGVFRRFVGDCEILAMEAIEAARYFPLKEREENTVIIAVSAGGSTGRIVEILERGKMHGCVTIVLTNNGESRCAKAAEYTYLTKTPFFPNDNPGLRSYFASTLSLMILSAVLGEIRSGEKNVSKLRREFISYSEMFFEEIDAIDDSCLLMAKKWENKKGFEVVADGQLFACGEFIAAKYAEVSGEKCTIIDSENYCHVNGLACPGTDIGTIVMAISDEANMSRVIETIKKQKKDGRDILLVSDKKPKELEEFIDFCRIPAPSSNFRFLLPLYAFVPGSLMASYHSELICEPYFRNDPTFFSSENMTINENAWKLI